MSEPINAAGAGMATGIVRIDGKLIIVLDFEKIVSEINPETGLKISDVEHMRGRERSEAPILIAEDSALLSKMIVNCLKQAGYDNITTTDNGQECWEKLNQFPINPYYTSCHAGTRSINRRIRLNDITPRNSVDSAQTNWKFCNFRWAITSMGSMLQKFVKY